MKRHRAVWAMGWRLGVGGLLLVWIFHTIFSLEGRRTWEQQGRLWDQLSRLEQWRIAWTYGPGELWDTLAVVDSAALLISLVFMGMTILLGILRWRLVLNVQGLNLSFARTAEISLVAHFFNSFLLGSTGGDLLKAYYAARETQHKKTEAVTTVLMDRLIGLFAMLLFACLMLLANLPLLASHRSLRALAGLVFVMMVSCGCVVGLSFWGGLSRSWPRARFWLRKLPKADLLERALEASRRFGKEPSFLLWTLLISMALNIFCVFQIMALAWGLKLNISPLTLFAIVPVIVCLSALPISPSGLGVRENLYVFLLGVKEISVDATSALSLSLLAYAGSLLWSLLGGIVYVTRKERDRLAEITEPESATEDL